VRQLSQLYPPCARPSRPGARDVKEGVQMHRVRRVDACQGAHDAAAAARAVRRCALRVPRLHSDCVAHDGVVLVALLSTIVTHPPVFLSFVNWELFRGVI
jgi:hypothetical protein